MGCKEKINGLALFIHRAVQISPFPLDFHVRLVKTPALAHGPLAAAELFLNLRGRLDDLAIKGGMIHSCPPLAHHLL
jgi:hypothetical protein